MADGDELTKERYDEIMAAVAARMWAGLERRPDGVWQDAAGNEYTKSGTYEISDKVTLTIEDDGSVEIEHRFDFDPIDFTNSDCLEITFL